MPNEMKNFSIKTIPEIPASKNDFSLEKNWKLYFERNKKFDFGEYMLIYEFADFSVNYYESSILDLLNDLIGEMDLVKSGIDHEILISGYPVARVKRSNLSMIVSELSNNSDIAIHVDANEFFKEISNLVRSIVLYLNFPD
jgi:hypothetical protein